MSVISYDAYESVVSNRVTMAKYIAQWSISSSNIRFRYGTKMTF
jgi:hypothetical protein